VAGAAEILLTCVGGTPEAKAKISAADGNRAFEQLKEAIRHQRHSIKGQSTDAPALVAATKPPPKKGVEKGGAKAKLIAALTQYHQYADGSCLNTEPIGNNELAR